MNRIRLALAAVTMVPVAAPLWAQAVVPIRFPAGQTGIVVSDRIVGRQFIDYRISLRAGQTLSVRLATLRGAPYFNVMEPNAGDVAIFIGSTNGADAEIRTRMNGAYVVRVYQMRADERRGAVAGYRLSVRATGGPATHPTAPAHHDGDALVRGTPYHATSIIRCRASAGASMGQCKAGVIRRPGSATVHLDTPDGGERTINFRNGRAVSSDASVPIVVTRQGDTSLIRIGRYEYYEIPDALPFGG